MLASLPIIGNLIDGVATYFGDKQKVKAAVSERRDELKKLNLEAKITSAQAGLNSDIEQDTTSRKLAGFMDDFSFYSVWIIILLSFYPDAQPHILEGFKTIEAMPTWFQYTVGGMLVSIWGYRRLLIPIIEIVVKRFASKL